MTPKDLTTYGGATFDPAAEHIDLSPADPLALEIVQETLRLVLALKLPMISEVVKSVATLGGLIWQRRKAERGKDLILALYEQFQRMPLEYLRREEAEDLVEDVLRRYSEQPDPSRRETMKRIFLRIVEEPREHVANRLLLRLADELPADALKILAVLDGKVTEEERAISVGHYALAMRMGLQPSQMSWPLSFLINASLVDEESLNITPGFGAAGDDLMFLLTPLGRTFVEYGRG